jgi:hypothetical protein
MILLFLACDKDQLVTPEEFQDLYGVDHQFYTEAVSDECFDGALSALFMPEGPESAHAFEYPIYMPLLEETPFNTSVDLREPFMGMDVVISGAADGSLSISSSVIPSVLLGGNFGDCSSTMTVDAEFSPRPSGFVGLASIALSAFESGDDSCPVPSSNECTVQLQVYSELIQ